MASINITEALYGSANIRFNLMRVNTAGQNFCSFEMTVGTDNVALFFPISCADKLEETVKQLNDAVSPARSGNKGEP